MSPNWHDVHYHRTTPQTNPGHWQHFTNVQDPYNPQNAVSGHIQRAGGDQYGSLLITHVNGHAAPQEVLAMPKASYPYDKAGNWLLEGAAHLDAYVKYDGTNICQFCYQDAQGNPFTSFKVRPRPFVPPYFRSMLDLLLERYPELATTRCDPEMAYFYELFGARNPMLIRYVENLELRVLSCRMPLSNNLISPEEKPCLFTRLGCPIAEPVNPPRLDNLREQYLARQRTLGDALTPAGEAQFEGSEGDMLYVRFNHGARSKPGEFTRLIKLKAPQIEEIHQTPDRISTLEIRATARNLWEATDNPEFSDLVELLAEDWSDDQIGRSMANIERVLAETLATRAFQDRVLEVYQTLDDPNAWHNDRPGVMRALSAHFKKQDMTRAYNALLQRVA